MRLLVCFNTSARGGRACGVAHKALVDAGHDPAVEKV